MQCRQLVEAAARQPPDLAVAQRRDAARALAVRQQRHLADDVAGRDLGHQDRLLGAVLVLVAEHAEAAAGHDIDGVGRLALAEQRRAARQHEQAELLFDRRHAVRLEIGEQWRALQRLAQPQSCGILDWRDDAHPSVIRCSCAVHALECPADRLVGARPHHLPPLVAGREETLLHVGLERTCLGRGEIAALVQPVVGAHGAQNLGHRISAVLDGDRRDLGIGQLLREGIGHDSDHHGGGRGAAFGRGHLVAVPRLGARERLGGRRHRTDQLAVAERSQAGVEVDDRHVPRVRQLLAGDGAHGAVAPGRLVAAKENPVGMGVLPPLMAPCRP